jgi:L-cysteine:1D-myo-inositol 2-amino-2-deoxy-alpha-D-glucopyranoside ligase
MQLFNTLSRKLENFNPQGDPVSLYVCGITPYDTTHLGHAFTYSTADILVRYLELNEHQVRYVQNVTDIDDDILRKAQEVDQDWQSLGDRWTRHFIQDMIHLNIRPPDEYPRATDVIEQIIEMVADLLNSGVAYEAGGNVYFDLERWPEYGKLSRIPRDEMLPVANERGNKPDDPHKKSPLDFVLWQAQKAGEPEWESPWGPGRPGWHIECSVMSTCLLDKTIDIHMGGEDLVFPHHESEIAQVEPVTGQAPFVRYWMHVAMVQHEGEKMSKSLGNLVMIRDLLEDWSVDALRIYMAMHHYRKAWGHDLDQLKQASSLAEKLKMAAQAESGVGSSYNPLSFRVAFAEAMDNDLDTPAALQVLGELAGEILSASSQGKDISIAQAVLRTLSGALGLRLDITSPESRVQNGWSEHVRRFQA